VSDLVALLFLYQANPAEQLTSTGTTAFVASNQVRDAKEDTDGMHMWMKRCKSFW